MEYVLAGSPPAKRCRRGSTGTGGEAAPCEEAAAGSSGESDSSDAGEAPEDGAADMQVSSGAAKKKKKARKRKKKPQQHSEAKEPHSLVVMPKCEWKRLRNKYLALQKATMAQIKRSLLLPPSGGTPMPSPSHPSLLAAEDMAEDAGGGCSAEPDDQGAPVPTLDFQPGVIIKLLTDKPVSNTTEFKNNIRQLADVAYVDVMEGDSVAYVRCANAEAASQFIERQKDSFCGSLSLLTGDEEKAYWDKITLDRETRRSHKTRQKKRVWRSLKPKSPLLTFVVFPYLSCIICAVHFLRDYVMKSYLAYAGLQERGSWRNRLSHPTVASNGSWGIRSQAEISLNPSSARVIAKARR
ncbi:hypothetical protein HPB48_005766 [Haemaphysalis longicornis]|uniref:XRRM domain-containing protein n=1 Tax=Haemaphysalis longicornis TaxID=44386 RepID=A0A9J6FBI0_HAELO|nr:hypothetical protein HPB48_005766 [Haemaphysalis longicornis]